MNARPAARHHDRFRSNWEIRQLSRQVGFTHNSRQTAASDQLTRWAPSADLRQKQSCLRVAVILVIFPFGSADQFADMWSVPQNRPIVSYS